MTDEDANYLNEVSRDISPDVLERDDRLIDLLADVVSYASDAHRIVEQVVAWQVRSDAGSGSRYAFISVPGDMWLKLEALAKRARPELLDQADDYLRRLKP